MNYNDRKTGVHSPLPHSSEHPGFRLEPIMNKLSYLILEQSDSRIPEVRQRHAQSSLKLSNKNKIQQCWLLRVVCDNRKLTRSTRITRLENTQRAGSVSMYLEHSSRRWAKCAGSIPDIIFHLYNPSGHTMALGLTQPLTKVSTRNTSWGVKAAGAWG